MNLKLKNLNLTYRKLKISDYEEFRKLFYHCFKKKISFNFYKWRYFNDKTSFCWGVFNSSNLIANIDLVSVKLNNYNKELTFSRHSSMVLRKFRGKGIFSNLQNHVKNKILNQTTLIVMWPNKNNFANFGLNKKYIINKKYYLYRSLSISSSIKKTKNYNFNELLNLKKFLEKNNSFFLKNYIYFKKRYLSYKRNEYLINEFKLKELKSYFILKRNRDKLGLSHVVLDHFGSEKIYKRHLSNLKIDFKRLIFLSNKKLNKSKYQLIDFINFKVGIIKQSNLRKKRKILNNKKIFLGDTDIFITIK